MGKTARAVHWTGHRHSARVPCPGAAGCVTLRFVRGFSSAVYAAGKDDPTVSAGGGNQEGGHPLFGVFPALRRDGGPGQLPASVGDTRNPACRGAALAADSRERTAPIKPAYGISMNAIPGREPFRRIIGQNCQPVKHGVWDSSPAGACMETRRGTTFALGGSVRKESAAAEPGTKGEKSPRALRLGDFSCDD